MSDLVIFATAMIALVVCLAGFAYYTGRASAFNEVLRLLRKDGTP